MRLGRILFAVLMSAPTGFAQDGDTSSLSESCEAFTAAWNKRDSKLVGRMLTPDARLFGAGGGDASGLGSVMRSINRYLKGAKSEETICHREIKRNGDTAFVATVSRVDHQRGQRRFSSGRRQTQVWVKQDGQWKIAHLHLSNYTNFETAILAFENADKAGMPKPGGTVFVGSSSIRMWKTLKDDFPESNTVRRGFGGSQLVDSIVYANRIITPYAPTKVAVYAGDNDIAAGKKANRVLADFKTLVSSIHARAPEAKVGFIAIKPSRSRWNLWPEMDKANRMVADYAKSNPRVTYLDIATPMLGKDGGKPAKDLFVADGLHMTAKGYEAWTKVIRPWVESH